MSACDLVGAGDKANAYVDELRRGLDAIEAESAKLARRPKVYFEEWDEPPITGIRWVAELVRISLEMGAAHRSGG